MKTATLAVLAAFALPCAAAQSASARKPPIESFVEIPGGPAPLKATMLKPAGVRKPPVVVILPGSGPTDRDGNNPLGVKGATYRLLAEGLAQQGVASLRMDKRGMFASSPAAENPNAVFVSILAEDALAWAAKARAETGAPCAWLAGHSEGVLVALIAARKPAGVCGLILIAGAGRPIDAVVRQQLEANPANAPILPSALAALDAVKAGQTVDASTLHPGLRGLFNEAVQPFLRDEMSFSPTALIAAYGGPVLIVQGSTDLQITLEDANLLKAAQPKAELAVLEGVNHVLKTAPAERRANAATYADPSLPLAPEVVPAIAGFIRAHQGMN